MVFVDKHTFFSFYMNSKGENPKRRRKMEKGENPKQRKKREKKSNSKTNSKVLKCILHCLKNGLYLNVLTWTEVEGVFKVKFLHQKNPKWNKSMLSLFKAVDKTMPPERYKKYINAPNYSEESKTRFRANLKKLCMAKALKLVEEKTRSDKFKEKSYKIVNYSEKFMSDLLKDSNIGEIIENICEMDVNTTEEKDEMESQVLLQISGDTSNNDFAFPHENGSFNMDCNPIKTENGIDLVEESNLNGSFNVASDLLHMQTNYGLMEEPTLNMLNISDYPAFYNQHLENIYVRTVSVSNSEVSAFSQNNIVQTMSAHNSAVMQSSPLCCNFTKVQNDIFDVYPLPKDEESFNLTHLCNATWNVDLTSSPTPKNLPLPSTVSAFFDKAYGYTDV